MNSIARDKGSAVLLLVLVVTTALCALGLGILAVGLLESEAARSGVASRQAACAAESGLRAVKHWFDAPMGSAGAWEVPAAGEVDRSARRVDPDGDGTSLPFSVAPAPWNVAYRQGRDDMFERPYGGGPSLSTTGDERGPDLLIAWDAADPRERSFLSRLSTALFPAAPAPNLALRLTRIAVYAPPRLLVGGVIERLGIATIEVSAQLVRAPGEEETVLATARAQGVLQEIPYASPAPLIVRRVEDGRGLDVRWGALAASGDVNLGADPIAATVGGWPWRSAGRRLIADADLDGIPDDTDGDGVTDLDEWMSLPDSTIADPWFRVIVGGTLVGAPPGAQPFPFNPALIPGSYETDDDRSALFQGASFPSDERDAAIFRVAAADGGSSSHLYLYVEGSSPPLFREGSGPPIGFDEATRGKEGLFYFDTVDGRPPRDVDGDGTQDNLTPPIVVSEPDWWSAGCLFVNAASFSPGASARAGSAEIAPPGEPCADIDGDGACGVDEPYLGLGYPPDPLAPGGDFRRFNLATESGGTRRRESGPPLAAPVTFAGLLLLSGRLEGASSARIYGAVAAAADAAVPRPVPGERLQILFDERLARDGWPPASSRLPRTLWQGRSVSP